MNYKDVKTPVELYEFLKLNIKYGFISKIDKKKYRRKELKNDILYDEKIVNEYYLQTPKELLNSKIGVCYDQVELIREWMINNGYEVLTYYCDFHNHVILIYKDNKTYNLFERTLPEHNGIYKAQTLEECLVIYKNIQFNNNESIDEILLYPYEEVMFGCGFKYFIKNARKNENKKIVLKRN
jgi:hypothetical protein